MIVDQTLFIRFILIK